MRATSIVPIIGVPDIDMLAFAHCSHIDEDRRAQIEFDDKRVAPVAKRVARRQERDIQDYRISSSSARSGSRDCSKWPRSSGR